MRSIFPNRWIPVWEPTYAEVDVCDQEAAHQLRWEMLADWCWERDIYLGCDIRTKRSDYEKPFFRKDILI